METKSKKTKTKKPIAQNLASSSRKDLIVEAAIVCFYKNGVGQTRFNEIAATAKIDQPLIHYYYPTFDDLFIEVVNKVLESLKVTTFHWISKNPNDIEKTLFNYSLAPFYWIKENPALFSLWLHFYHLASFNPRFSKLNAIIRETGRDRISLMLFDGLEKGVFSKDKTLSVKERASIIQGLITGNSIMAATESFELLEKYALLTANHIIKFCKST
jgi:AcrR family transcriptional regulator